MQMNGIPRPLCESGPPAANLRKDQWASSSDFLHSIPTLGQLGQRVGGKVWFEGEVSMGWQRCTLLLASRET